MKEGARGIQSIEVSGRILNALIICGEPMMLKDLAEAAGLKPAQSHAYLTSLKNVGLVHQDHASGLYSAGPSALRLGVRWLDSHFYTSKTITELKTLTEELGVMSLLTVWGQFGPTIVYTYAGLTQAALNIRQGSLFSVTGTATGRVFAAFCDDQDVQEKIADELSRKNASNSIGEELTKADFTELVSEIRGTGYSTAREKPIPNVNAVSVPIFGPGSKLECVATLIGNVDKLPVGKTDVAVQRMLEVSRRVSWNGKVQKA